MQKVFATGWMNNGLDQLDQDYAQNSAAILFYSGANQPDDIARLFSYRQYFKSVLYVDMEDFEAEDVALGNLPYMAPNQAIMQKIVDFIKAHRGEDFVVSCAAGVSRTGATVNYLEHLGYERIPEEYYLYPNKLMQAWFHKLDADAFNRTSSKDDYQNLF